MTPRQRSDKARNAAEHRHAVDRLVRAYESASPEAKEEGRAWYANAQATAARLARPDAAISTDRAAAVIAALSPQVRWRKNIESAANVIEYVAGDTDTLGPLDGYPANHDKAARIVAGAPVGTGPGDGFGGDAPKVRNFYRNIMGDTDAVTLDTWAMRAATGRDGVVPTGALYRRAENWYRDAAARVGETPRDFQAIVWLATRGETEHNRDKEAIA